MIATQRAVSPVDRFELPEVLFSFRKPLTEKVEACVPKGLLLYKSHDRKDHNYPQIFASVKLFSSILGWASGAYLNTKTIHLYDDR